MAKLLVVAGGCAIASALVLSPAMVAAFALLLFTIAAVSRGVSGDERRVLLWILLVAVALRVIAVAALFLVSDPFQLSTFSFDGDGKWIKLKSLWIRNGWLGVPIDLSQFEQAYQAYGWSSYIYVLAYLQYLLGPAPYAVHLFSVCWTVAAAGLLYRLVRRSYGSTSGLVTLAIVLFLPTLFIWSVSAMKESWLLFLTTVMIAGTERAVRVPRWGARAGWVAAVVVAGLVLTTVRSGAIYIPMGALLLAPLGIFMAGRVRLLAASMVLLAVVGALILHQPAVQARVMSRVRASAALHIGHVNTEGYSYKVLDQRFYSWPGFENNLLFTTMTWDEGRRYVLRALGSFVLEPLPWKSVSRVQVLFIPQQMAWYALLMLAAVGAVAGFRKDALVTVLFIGVVAAGVVVIAPHEGNMGTLVRHRDGIVPFVACLSAIAVASMVSRLGREAIESSGLVRGARRLIGLMPFDQTRGLGVTWRESELAAAIDGLRAVERWQWLRWIGIALFAGAGLGVVLGPFGDQARSSLFACGATVVCALVLILYPRALVVGFGEWAARTSGPEVSG